MNILFPYFRSVYNTRMSQLLKATRRAQRATFTRQKKFPAKKFFLPLTATRSIILYGPARSFWIMTTKACFFLLVTYYILLLRTHRDKILLCTWLSWSETRRKRSKYICCIEKIIGVFEKGKIGINNDSTFNVYNLFQKYLLFDI